MSAEDKLAHRGVFKGADGLRRLAEADDFWDEQAYGTRLYFGPGIADYLHRGVLRAAVAALDAEADGWETVETIDPSRRDWGDSVPTYTFTLLKCDEYRIQRRPLPEPPGEG